MKKVIRKYFWKNKFCSAVGCLLILLGIYLLYVGKATSWDLLLIESIGVILLFFPKRIFELITDFIKTKGGDNPPS